MATAPVPREHRGPKYLNLTRRDWQCRPAVIIAAGPSLTAEDVEVVRRSRQADRIRVVSVSNAYKHCADFADVFFAGDRRYWRAYLAKMLAAGASKARMVTCCNATARADGIAHVRAANRPGLGSIEMTTGGNSGWMGLNLAFLYGARRMYLLGFDMQLGPDGEKHFDGSHPRTCDMPLNFSEWLHRIEKALPDLKKHGVSVTNCSRRTALKFFPLSTVQAELAITEETDA